MVDRSHECADQVEVRRAKGVGSRFRKAQGVYKLQQSTTVMRISVNMDYKYVHFPQGSCGIVTKVVLVFASLFSILLHNIDCVHTIKH